MTFKFKALALLCLCQCAQAAYVYEQDLFPRNVDIKVDWSNTPDIRGYLQVPAGGMPGSTSEDRPTLEELGIKEAHFYNAEVIYHNNPYFMYVGYQNLQPKGDAVLTEDLITHGQTIAAGRPISTSTKFDYYKVGLGYTFLYLMDELKFPIALEELFWKFDYQFSVPFQLIPHCGLAADPCELPAISDGRKFSQGTTRIFFGVDYSVTRRLTIAVDGAFSLPWWGLLRLNDFEGRVEYKLFETDKMALGPYFAVGYEYIHFLDTQTVPNDIHVTLNPYYTIGLKLSV